MGGYFSRRTSSKPQPTSVEKVADKVPAPTLGFAWVTLTTNDSYSLGALVLAHSLRNASTAHKLAVLITPGVSEAMREQLSAVFDLVKMVDVLDSKDETHLALLKRPELGITLTKLHCWRLTEFEKCVFLDADTLVLKNCDELFEREELSAAPDVGWPDCFNSGVFVYKPSIETFNNLVKFSLEEGTFDGGDQGLLNNFFRDWATKDINKHLPFLYNLTTVAVYSYVPAFKHFESDVRIVHFIGSGKPWLQRLDPKTKTVHPASGAEHLSDLLQKWWDVFCEKVQPCLTSNLECCSGMSNQQTEACVNDVLIETNDNNQTSVLVQPLTPYMDEDDSRQINLPYQQFDVKSSSGELLNMTFFEVQKEILDQQEPEASHSEGCSDSSEDYLQQKLNEEDENDGKESVEEGNLKLKMLPTEKISFYVETNPNSMSAETKQEVEDSERNCSQEREGEQSPFYYETFFPDENCVQNYLQQNISIYQPFLAEDKKIDSFDPGQEQEPLPRFLTIPENDQRQSQNTFINEETEMSQSTTLRPAEESEYFLGEKIEKLTLQEDINVSENHEKTNEKLQKWKWKSMSNLDSTVTANELKTESFWKSHPNLKVDPNKKFLMPKLKPLLPRRKSLDVPVSRPKITHFTEFWLSSDYKDSIENQNDKLGFIERHKLEEKGYHDIAIPVPKLASKFSKELQLLEETSNYDLTLCRRQRGNKPLRNITDLNNSRGENTCFLPVLKPLRPKESEVDGKHRSKGRLSKERGIKAKTESRKAREKARLEMTTQTSEQERNHNVGEILERLISFSKDYQGYFTKHETERLKTIIFKSIDQSYESPRLEYSKEFDGRKDTSFEKDVKFYHHDSKINQEVLEKVSKGQPKLLDVNGVYKEAEVTAENLCSACNTLRISSPEKTFYKSPENTQKIVEKRVASKTAFLHGSERVNAKIENENKGLTENVGQQTINKLEVKKAEPTYKGTRSLCSKEKIDVIKSKQSYLENKTQGNHVENQNGSKSDVENQIPSGKKKKAKAKITENSERKTKKSEDADVHFPGSKRRNKPLCKEKDFRSKRFRYGEAFPVKTPDEIRKPQKSRSINRTSLRPCQPSVLVNCTTEARPKVDDVKCNVGSRVDNSGIAGALAKLSLQTAGGQPGAESGTVSSAEEDYIRRQNWEMGTMDYAGRDSFDNIWSKICETIDGKDGKALEKPDLGATKTTSDDKSLKSDDLVREKVDISEETIDNEVKESVHKMKDNTEEQLQSALDSQTLSNVGASQPVTGIDQKAPSGEEVKDLDPSSPKTQEALEAFGKLFVSGPVAIKSCVLEEPADQKSVTVTQETLPALPIPEPGAPEKKEQNFPPENVVLTGPQQPVAEETCTKSELAELDANGKPRKGVINKLLELVGVGPLKDSKTKSESKSVFYDSDGKDLSQSVFYIKDEETEGKDKPDPASEVKPMQDPQDPTKASSMESKPSESPAGVVPSQINTKVTAEQKEPVSKPEESTLSKSRKSPSPSLILNREVPPDTGLVPPTPITSQPGDVPGKDEKFLIIDDKIKETAPVAGKQFDKISKEDQSTKEQLSEKKDVKSEVDTIIDAAKKQAEEQLRQEQMKEEGKSASGTPKGDEKCMALVPALEVFGKVFVSGPVVIKSETQDLSNEESSKMAGQEKADEKQDAEKSSTISPPNLDNNSAEAQQSVDPKIAIPMPPKEPDQPVAVAPEKSDKTLSERQPISQVDSESQVPSQLKEAMTGDVAQEKSSAQPAEVPPIHTDSKQMAPQEELAKTADITKEKLQAKVPTEDPTSTSLPVSSDALGKIQPESKPPLDADTKTALPTPPKGEMQETPDKVSSEQLDKSQEKGNVVREDPKDGASKKELSMKSVEGEKLSKEPETAQKPAIESKVSEVDSKTLSSDHESQNVKVTPEKPDKTEIKGPAQEDVMSQRDEGSDQQKKQPEAKVEMVVDQKSKESATRTTQKVDEGQPKSTATPQETATKEKQEKAPESQAEAKVPTLPQEQSSPKAPDEKPKMEVKALKEESSKKKPQEEKSGKSEIDAKVSQEGEQQSFVSKGLEDSKQKSDQSKKEPENNLKEVPQKDQPAKTADDKLHEVDSKGSPQKTEIKNKKSNDGEKSDKSQSGTESQSKVETEDASKTPEDKAMATEVKQEKSDEVLAVKDDKSGEQDEPKKEALPEESKVSTQPITLPRTLSKESEALEAFGKVFVSGPVLLKSEVAEDSSSKKVAEDASKEIGKGSDPHSEPLEKPISKSDDQPDAVHRSLLKEEPRPEGQHIYSNVGEEIRVTSDEDRAKDKPHTAKLTEQILKAIPEALRKPSTETVSEAAAPSSSSVEPQKVDVLDRPVTEEVTVEPQGGTSSAPPVPPRKNRSRGRQAPAPPPKKKSKN